MPRDRPTVPMAEAVSKIHTPIGILSKMLIINAAATVKKRYRTSKVDAVFTVLSSILLRKSLGSLFRLTIAMALANNTAAVVVFIPPAVDPGDPPISISMMIRARPALVMAVRSTVLKPAVLGVTA
jgi:hypothetical protein